MGSVIDLRLRFLIAQRVNRGEPTDEETLRDLAEKLHEHGIRQENIPPIDPSQNPGGIQDEI